MQKLEFKTFINGAGNDLKLAIDDVIGAISLIHEDMEKLKIKTSKPDSIIAQALLEYIGMEDGREKENLKILCGNEIQQYLEWVDDYCKEYLCSQEDALNLIIEGKI